MQRIFPALLATLALTTGATSALADGRVFPPDNCSLAAPFMAFTGVNGSNTFCNNGQAVLLNALSDCQEGQQVVFHNGQFVCQNLPDATPIPAPIPLPPAPPSPQLPANCGAANITADITTYDATYSLKSVGVSPYALSANGLNPSTLLPTANGSSVTLSWSDIWFGALTPSYPPPITDVSQRPPGLYEATRDNSVTFICDNGAFKPYQLAAAASYHYNNDAALTNSLQPNPQQTGVFRRAAIICDGAQIQCAGSMPIDPSVQSQPTAAQKQWLDKIIMRFYITPVP